MVDNTLDRLCSDVQFIVYRMLHQHTYKEVKDEFEIRCLPLWLEQYYSGGVLSRRVTDGDYRGLIYDMSYYLKFGSMLPSRRHRTTTYNIEIPLNYIYSSNGPHLGRVV